MLTVFLVSFVAMTLFFLFMAVGVMAGREPLKGTCGGLNNIGMRDGDCPVCGGNPAKCESTGGEADAQAAPLARDAMQK